jgi:hypothetical protein
MRASLFFMGAAFTVLAAHPAAAESGTVRCSNIQTGRFGVAYDLTYSTDPPSVTEVSVSGSGGLPLRRQYSATYDASKNSLSWDNGQSGIWKSAATYDIAGKKVTTQRSDGSVSTINCK